MARPYSHSHCSRRATARQRTTSACGGRAARGRRQTGSRLACAICSRWCRASHAVTSPRAWAYGHMRRSFPNSMREPHANPDRARQRAVARAHSKRCAAQPASLRRVCEAAKLPEMRTAASGPSDLRRLLRGSGRPMPPASSNLARQAPATAPGAVPCCARVASQAHPKKCGTQQSPRIAASAPSCRLTQARRAAKLGTRMPSSKVASTRRSLRPAIWRDATGRTAWQSWRWLDRPKWATNV